MTRQWWKPRWLMASEFGSDCAWQVAVDNSELVDDAADLAVDTPATIEVAAIE